MAGSNNTKKTDSKTSQKQTIQTNKAVKKPYKKATSNESKTVNKIAIKVIIEGKDQEELQKYIQEFFKDANSEKEFDKRINLFEDMHTPKNEICRKCKDVFYSVLDAYITGTLTKEKALLLLQSKRLQLREEIKDLSLNGYFVEIDHGDGHGYIPVEFMKITDEMNYYYSITVNNIGNSDVELESFSNPAVKRVVKSVGDSFDKYNEIGNPIYKISRYQNSYKKWKNGELTYNVFLSDLELEIKKLKTQLLEFENEMKCKGISDDSIMYKDKDLTRKKREYKTVIDYLQKVINELKEGVSNDKTTHEDEILSKKYKEKILKIKLELKENGYLLEDLITVPSNAGIEKITEKYWKYFPNIVPEMFTEFICQSKKKHYTEKSINEAIKRQKPITKQKAKPKK